jgi:hypothetical protein
MAAQRKSGCEEGLPTMPSMWTSSMGSTQSIACDRGLDLIARATGEEAGAKRAHLYRVVTQWRWMGPAGAFFLTVSASQVVGGPASPAVPRGRFLAPSTPCIWAIGSVRQLCERLNPGKAMP